MEQPVRRSETRWRSRVGQAPLKAPGDIPGDKTGELTEETKKPPSTRKEVPISGDRRNSELTHPSYEETPLDVGNCVGISEHRPDSMPAWESDGRGFTPGEPYFEQIGPDTWAETAWSRARCVFGGHAPVAEGDQIACAEHRRQMEAS